MQQLWMNHKRIDSIGQLRKCFAESAQEHFDDLCLQLLDHAGSGVLAAWLAHQSESAGGDPDPEAKKLTMLIRRLRDGVRDEVQLHQSLGELTGVSGQCFAAEYVQKRSSSARALIKEKKAQLKAQPWWNTHSKTFDLLKDQDWPLVVLDNSQLQLALELLRESSAVQRTLYICNTEQMEKKWYVLDLQGIENVIIAGIAGPNVQYSWFGENREINTKQRKIYFRDLSLRFHQKNCLTDYRDTSTNFQVTMG